MESVEDNCQQPILKAGEEEDKEEMIPRFQEKAVREGMELDCI